MAAIHPNHHEGDAAMRALVIKHDYVSEPGHVGARLIERGYELDVVTVVPRESHHAPAVAFDFPGADGWDLIVSLGAPWSVYDGDSVGTWIEGELALLREAHRTGVPVLGICFGAQALATALGGSVERAPRPEIGWTEVETDDPDLVPSGPWFQWHYDRFTPPPGAVELARTSVGAQAFTVGRSLGVQFHPEATAEVVRGWIDFGGADQCTTHNIDPTTLLTLTQTRDPDARLRAAHLVDTFLDRVGAPVS
ncbi:type 1 glutamine amidotransferase [Actinocorallia sp. A-T 12471]|uniref:type 1 glutamine amidotransferase n=1 Tax=Actinocorallia sp. A-T 12471 TaxID=3089813 RepID=UPI0029D2F95D|nr:type 1 glutamine amidotransferase [Actinocorallia sp. A-T 12471]MDX6741124.1 type 1 glutamine amidotransferase [Actinocorallia sp. A-T 12471]